MEKRINSFNLSVSASGKISRTADVLDRNKSETLERIIMAIPEKSLIRYARKQPIYINDNNEEVNNGQ